MQKKSGVQERERASSVGIGRRTRRERGGEWCEETTETGVQRERRATLVLVLSVLVFVGVLVLVLIFSSSPSSCVLLIFSSHHQLVVRRPPFPHLKKEDKKEEEEGGEGEDETRVACKKAPKWNVELSGRARAKRERRGLQPLGEQSGVSRSDVEKSGVRYGEWCEQRSGAIVATTAEGKGSVEIAATQRLGGWRAEECPVEVERGGDERGDRERREGESERACQERERGAKRDLKSEEIHKREKTQRSHTRDERREARGEARGAQNGAHKESDSQSGRREKRAA
jgi:hypothetical protein